LRVVRTRLHRPRRASRLSGDRLASPRGGFSLIELLAVLIIISVLAYFIVANVTGAREVVEAGLTRTRITQIEAMLSSWSDEQGDFPLSSFTKAQGIAPNATNLGAECLYLALCGENSDGVGVLDDTLSNTDGDRLQRRLEGFEALELFEVTDDWGNPLAYQHHRDYGRKDVHVTLDPTTGEELESVVDARRNQDTRRYHQAHGFQLVSAGVDGRFGTEDDITNFTE
jgi:prepilin-type N-terminal cleavage/methylation domain-containing protein